MKTQFLFAILALCTVAVTGCQRSVPPVPPSNRTVVGPSGSTNSEKPWNAITPNEGNAILGPLSNTRR